nr:unnamed protein product [Spirometra erinaceieuropaei]
MHQQSGMLTSLTGTPNITLTRNPASKIRARQSPVIRLPMTRRHRLPKSVSLFPNTCIDHSNQPCQLRYFSHPSPGRCDEILTSRHILRSPPPPPPPPPPSAMRTRSQPVLTANDTFTSHICLVVIFLIHRPEVGESVLI